jgi:hypothetical protein
MSSVILPMVTCDYNQRVPAAYDQNVYSRQFARLLNRALKQGGGNAQKGLDWLERRYRLVLTMLLTRYKAEMADAYMDVREHLVNRIEGEKTKVETGS